MLARILIGLSLSAGALLLVAPQAAFADDPVDLAGAYVLDESRILGSAEEDDVRAALDRLFEQTGAKVFVVYVDTFENPTDGQGWALDSAELSGLGSTDLLVAIATQDRNFGVDIGADFPLSDSDIDTAIDEGLIPALRDDDWAGGPIAFADSLVASQAPSPVPAIVGGVAAAGAGTAVVVAVVRSRRKKKQAADAAQAEVAALDQRAGRLLVQLDDALKTSEQELGFAQAQFGEKQTTDFVTALADAKGLAKQAFELQQKLDDAYPETPEQRRAMTEQLIQLAEQADTVLDAQAEAFAGLRQLEKNAPQVLEQVAADRSGLEARIAAAEQTIAELAAEYPAADLKALHGMPAQARKLDAFAATTVAKAREVLSGAKGAQDAGAAVAVRAAQQAVGQVEQLIAGVDRVKADLAAKAAQDAENAARLDAQTRDARSRVESAQDYITTHRGAVGATARTRISEAARHLEQAAALAASDPATALTEAQDAERMAAAALDLARGDVDDAESQLAAREESHYPAQQQDSAFNGAVLGGILGELFGGGGGSSSSSGGGWWGGSSGSSSSGSSWGSSGWGGGSSHHGGGGGLFGGGSSGGGHSSGGSSRSRGGRGGRF